MDYKCALVNPQKILIGLLTIFLAGVQNVNAQWLSGYSNRKLITINSNYVGEDQTNFPFYFNLSDDDFKEPTNCNSVKNANAYDVVFTNLSGSVTYDHEIISYNSTTGQYQIWVNIPSVSASTDTEVYMYFGRRGVSLDPSSADTWPTIPNKGVWHFDIDGSDATTASNSLNVEGGSSYAVGVISNAITFDGITQNAAKDYDTDFDFGAGGFSVLGWIKAEPNTGGSPVQLKRVIETISDLAEEPKGGGSIDHDDFDIELGRDVAPSVRDFILVGIKFSNINIPEGAVIHDAYLDFEVKSASSEFAKFDIYVENGLDPADFDGTSNKPSDRVLGSSVKWEPGTWSEGEFHSTSDISSLVQSQVDISGWDASTKDIVFLIEGLGERVSDEEVSLVVEYEEASTSSITSSVSSTEDDVEEAVGSTGTMGNSGPLSITPGTNDWVGVRFDDVDVPNGAVIEQAYIEFVAFETRTDNLEVDIYIEDIANSPAFNLNNNELELERQKTSAIRWSLPGTDTWTSGSTYQTPDIKSIIEGIFSKGGWESRNAITILLDPIDGRRLANNYGNGSALAPRLIIEYSIYKSDPQTVVSRHNNGGFKIWSDETGKLSFGINEDGSGAWNEDTKVTSIEKVDESQWHHFAAVKDGTESIAIYIDGELEEIKYLEEQLSIGVASSGTDDAEEKTYLGSNSNTTTDNFLEIGYRLTYGEQEVGFRFPSMNIPRGAQIASATLQLITAGANANSDQCRVEVKGYVGDMASFTGSNGDISSRISSNGTSSTVLWDMPDQPATATTFTSPDLKNIIQDIVDDSSWPLSGGGSIGLFLESLGDAGQRKLPSVDNSSGAGAALYISYRETDFGSVSGTNPSLYIGDFDGTDNENLKGAIDELQLINTSLSSADVEARYNNITKTDFYTIGSIDQVTWTGGSTDFNLSSNWNTGISPWDNIDVVIPDLANDPQLTAATHVGNLTAAAGATLDLNGFQMDADCSCQVDDIQGGTLMIDENINVGSASGGELRLDNIQIASGKEVNLGSDLRIDNSLVFDGDGHIWSNGQTVTFSQNLLGAYQTSHRNSTVILNDNGKLEIESVTSGTTAVFNISLDENENTFSRVELKNNDVSTEVFDITICDSVFSDGACDDGGGGTEVTHAGIGMTWDINSTKPTDADVDATFYWHTSMEMTGFIRSQAQVNTHDGTKWLAVDILTTLGDEGNNIYSIDGNLASFSKKGIGETEGVLPVELLNFTAERDGEHISIKWETQIEINNDHFLVEKSIDGKTFSLLDKVNGAGNTGVRSSYELIDPHPYPGFQFYRLTQVDFDGTYEVLGTRLVDYSDGPTRIVDIYPNPSSDFLKIKGLVPGQYQLNLMSLNGSQVAVDHFYMDYEFEHRLDLSNIPEGIYLLRLLGQYEDFQSRIVIDK